MRKNKKPMKQLGSLVPILLLLGMGVTSGLAAAELTASQQVQPPIAAVGETATVTLTLAYKGDNATEIMVVPILPPGIVTDMPGTQTASLNSGSSVPISYPIRAVESGNYQITSQISYTEKTTTRRLNMLSKFTATGGPESSTPGPTTLGSSIPAASGSSVPALYPDAPMQRDNRPRDNRPSDTQSSNTQPSDTQPSDTQSSNTQPSDTQSSNTQPSDTQSSDTQSSDTQSSDTQSSDTQSSNTQPSDTQSSNGPMPTTASSPDGSDSSATSS